MVMDASNGRQSSETKTHIVRDASGMGIACHVEMTGREGAKAGAIYVQSVLGGGQHL